MKEEDKRHNSSLLVFAFREQETSKQTILQRNSKNGRQVGRDRFGANTDEFGPTVPTHACSGSKRKSATKIQNRYADANFEDRNMG